MGADIPVISTIPIQGFIAHGGFGSPTLFVRGGGMYFGNDQLPIVRQALLMLER
jgi:hypothetical protein